MIEFKPHHDETNSMAFDSDQPGLLSSLIRVFTVLIYTVRVQRRLRLDWADAQADPRHQWAGKPRRLFSYSKAHS